MFAVIGSQEDARIIEELGPIPETGSTIFSGNNFLITYAEQKNHKWGVRTANKGKHKSESDTDYTSETST